jgi:hypothetical protein
MKTNKNISGRLQALIDKKLEGILSPEDKKELGQMLSASEEAKSYAKQMEELHESLLLAGQAKKEISIEQEVLKIIRKKPSLSLIEMTTPFNIRMRSFNKELVKYAAIFIIGLLLGSAMTFLLLPEISPLSKREIGATVSARSGQALTISKDSWQIQIQPVMVSDIVVLVLNSRTTDSMQMNLYFNQQTYHLESTQLLSYEFLPEVASQPGEVGFIFNGSLSVQVILKQLAIKRSAIILEVVQDARIVYKKEVLLL